MESIETFVGIFKKSWKEKNKCTLGNVMNQLPDYLKTTSRTDADQILEIILRGQDGMFQCLRKVLDTPSLLNGDRFIKDCFKAFQCIIDFSQQYFKPYILETRNLCFYCMKTKCTYYAGKIASQTLKKLIEFYSNYDLQLDEIIEYFVHSSDRYYSKKDASIYYITLGAIGKHCPKLESINGYINEIFIKLLKDLMCQHIRNNTKPQPEEIKTYLECYLDLFENFVPFENDSSKSEIYLKELYSIILIMCDIKTVPKLYRNMAIEFISCTTKYFESLIFQDYHKWYTLFISIMDNVESNMILNVLRNFYNIIATHLMKEQREDVFQFFRNEFIVTIECERELSPRKLLSIVNGLGEFSVTYSKYAPTEGHKVFQAIAIRALQFTNKSDDDFKTAANYLQTLSQIARYSSNITFYQISILTELSLRVIKGFPELKIHNLSTTIKALNATFVNISYLEKNLQRQFFYSVFREGILWSCTHTLYVDLQLQQELESIPKKQICYKDYLPFWHSLFNIDNQDKSVVLILQMFDYFISVLKMYITKLNLNIVDQDDELFSNTLLPLKAENETDIWFFINLVDLYLEIFKQVDGRLMENSMEKLMLFLINYSYKYPLISGFHKLITVIIKNIEDYSDYQQNFNKSSRELISQYLSDILTLVSEFPEELQITCIFLMFGAPSFLIKNLINDMLPIFEIAFSIGLNNLSLAYSALEILEHWTESPEIEVSNDLLKKILDYMEPYLSTNERSSKAIEIQTEVEKTQGNTISSSKVSLEDLQNKILLFYGSLNSVVLYDFVRKKSSDSNATWNEKNLLKYELPFPDIRLEVNLDKYLLRIVELTYSGDQKIKISACELFHSVVSMILGKKLMDKCFSKNLCIAVLRLGCDANDSIKNLFHPLVIQLTHYLSSRLMIESKTSQDFIDSLFDGLSEEFNTNMRDHCGQYLKEFTQWSIKQSTERDLTKDPNVLSIIRKIKTLTLYPSNKTRLAAVSAFNSLYTIFRENVDIVQTYWLEFLYTFVNCLEEYDNLQVISAIDHVEKVIEYYKYIFNSKNHNRRKPPGFVDETLGGCSIWLFAHCGSLKTKCRNKCMILFENLLPLITHQEDVKRELEKRANEIVLNNLKIDFKSITISTGQTFLKTLDFSIWVMKKNFISSTCLFECVDISDGVDTFSSYFAKFVKLIVHRDTLNLNLADSKKLIEAERLVDLTNEIVLKILEFISTVLEVNNDDILQWSNDLYVLIVRSILSPQKIGLTAKSLRVSNKYYTQLEQFVILMINKSSTPVLKNCFDVFLSEGEEDFSQFAEIQNITEFTSDMTDRLYTLNLFVKGLQIVKKCKLFDFEKEKQFTVDYWQTKTTDIFKSLKIWMTGNYVCRKLNENVKDYLNELMALYLDTQQSETMKGLIDLIATNDILETSTGNKILHGEYFLDTFREPILSSMLKNATETMNILDEFYAQYPQIVLCTIEELILFAQRNKSIETEVLAEEVLKRCDKLNRLVNDIQERKGKFFNINHLAVKLLKKPMDVIRVDNYTFKEMDLWLSREFAQAKDLERKTILLQHFIICLADETADSEYSFSVLSHLRDMDDKLWLQTMRTNEVQRFHASTLFTVLLKSLLTMKSLLVYRAAINFSAGVSKLLCNENLKKYLEPYFISISDVIAFRSLEVCYQTFMGLNLDEQRLDVLRNFLLPSLESSKRSLAEKFYEKFSQEMIKCIKQDIDTSSNYELQDRKRLIINKIACFSVFELFFARFDITFDKIKDPSSGVETTLTSFLVKEGMKLRSYTTTITEEKEITRLMHCSALNCCISIISRRREEEFYKFIFMEDRANNQLIWERIIDCQRKYELPLQSISSVRKGRRKLINIRSDLDKRLQNSEEYSVSYRYRHDLSQLSFVEDIHAYDLNDATVLSEPSKKLEGDHRLDFSFEVDEFNENECMPMVSGVLIHMYNSGVTSLPGVEELNVELPEFLKHFRSSFVSERSNVILFLLKIMCNTKDIFVPYFKHMFLSVAKALVRQFSLNQIDMNYIVRDFLLLIIESRYVPSSLIHQEVHMAQLLFENLLVWTSNGNAGIQKYNLEIIESLCTLWSESLVTWPKNMIRLFETSEIGYHILLIFLRVNVCDARNQLMQQDFLKKKIIGMSLETSKQHGRNSTMNVELIEKSFEMLGMILRFNEDPEYEERLISRMFASLIAHGNIKNDHSSRFSCAVYAGWKSESDNCTQMLLRLARSQWQNTSLDSSNRFLELYLDRLISKQIDPEKVISELDSYVGLNKILSSRTLNCLGLALQILNRLITFIPEPSIRKYLDCIAKDYCSPELCLLEHRLLSYKCLTEAYSRFVDSPSTGLWLAQIIRGFEDPSDEVQECLLSFWRKQFHFPETCCERLLKLLSLYTPDFKDNFSRLICLVMLDLTSKSPDVDRTMFSPLIEQCSFREWNPLVEGRSTRKWRQLGSIVPLFAPTLLQATQRLESRMSTGSYGSEGNGNSFVGSLRIRETGELIFEPTLPTTSSNERVSTRIPDPSQNQLSKRFVENIFTEKTSASESLVKLSHYHSQLKKEKNYRQNSCKFYRKYRIGDFPDVELTHTSFILCLRQLMMNDWFFCKDLTVGLVCSLFDRLKDSDKYNTLLSGINRIFEKFAETEEERNNFAPAVLEIVQHVGDIQLRPKCVGKLCKNMKLDALGIVLLEESNIRSNYTLDHTELQDEPPTKRMKRDFQNDNWIALANLYKLIGYSDVVASILRHSDSFSRNVKAGALAQIAGEWANAKQSFEMDQEAVVDMEQDYCLDSMFECMRELSLWGDINKSINKILTDDYKAVWTHPKKMLLLPWIFEGQLHKVLDVYTSDKNFQSSHLQFVQNVNQWIKPTDTFEIKSNFGQELSVILLCSGQKSEEASKFCLLANLNRVREQWIRVSSIAENARFGILTKLRGMHNIDAYIKTIKADDINEATNNLIQYWTRHLPSDNEDLASWNMHVSYRLTFAKLLHEKLQNDSEDSSLLNKLLMTSARQRIVICDLAMKNKNNAVAKKHSVRSEQLIHSLSEIEELTETSEFNRLRYDFMLTAAKYKFVCAENETLAKNKCKYYVNSWKIANDVLEDKNSNDTIKNKIKHHLFELMSSMRQAAEHDEELSLQLTDQNFVAHNMETLQEETFSEKLVKYSFNILKSICNVENGKEMAESYSKFGKYCYSLMHDDRVSISMNLIEDFINSILTAMSLGSLEAARYFPCLLKYEYYNNNSRINGLFISKSSNVPTWLFLFWQSQIVAYLDKPLAHLLIPIMQRLVQDYPNGVVYDFRQAYANLSRELQVKPDIRFMYESLFTDSKLETFIEAMHHVCQPENYLYHHLSHLIDSKENFEKNVNLLIEKSYGKESDQKGLLYKIAIDKYRLEVEKLKNVDYDTAKSMVKKLREELDESLKRRIKDNEYQALQLKDYSLYLGYFTDKDLDIEIPGQYCKREKPLLQYHTKISKFDRSVSVMKSKCYPIKINIIGNDAKLYGFLVKFGDDLRQDQRLQQIFNITNETLVSDKNCRQRYLAINTYHVVPLSASLGLIEWVNETKSLREFVEFSMKDTSVINTVLNKYQNWISKASKPSKNVYKEALVKYDRITVITKMKEFIDCFDWDHLRKTFTIISPSLDCFVSLRHNFITSYAAMCVVHWITGVGDRHLENMLIEVKSGRCYGIDFGAAFGAGVDQAVPELVPFRLTSQILGLLKPFDEKALLGVTMTHVLKALRNERGPILACFDIFIHEPLNWSENRKKKLYEDYEYSAEIKWSAKKKIKTVEMKLNGIDSSTIMIDELSNMHGRHVSNEYFSRYTDIVNGTDQNNSSFRSTVLNKKLTAEEQVSCLLEHAKDLNLLGRMYAGWLPFI